MPSCTDMAEQVTENDPTPKENVTSAAGTGGDASTDTTKMEHEGDAERNGYVVMKHAIPESIIAETHVDESEFKVSPSGQYKEFKKGAPGQKIVEYFVKNVSKQSLIDLGVSKTNAEKNPITVAFGEYLLDEHEPLVQRRTAGPSSYVYVTIATSERLSPEEGLPEFIPGSHRLQAGTIGEIFNLETDKITLYRGWAVAWTPQLLSKWPRGGGGSYVLLVYPKEA
ncbi:hypothetical protein K469DRAFT_684016 [Zopfia rhizophila CBS 207.26]|uniref:Uncharacterized protein n=1 Tax=Zopfia rhizophila CBS 207.26 TaxID=1314779 RepID=A0A6A6D7H5_9PEZI|nr:hypothetical protein K469DRAFT_684016 [Zopfia rhizophila CBS 207.26]